MDLLEIFINSSGVSTDTRTIRKGELFFALRGENFDGNLYVEKALENGASYAVTDRKELRESPQVIVVEDTLIALQNLATRYRELFNIVVVCLTGSNGKTTNKELLKSLLSEKFKVYATEGNLNNHIGVPLSILRMDKNTELGLFELGANHKGEIADLCKMVKPTHGFITNIGKAHLEGFGSLDGVKEAKSELKNYLLENGGKFYINEFEDSLKSLVDKYSMTIEEIWENRDCWMLFNQGDTIELIIQSHDRGKIKKSIDTSLSGIHNVENLRMTVSLAIDFGVELDNIAKVLTEFKLPKNRFELFEINERKVFLDAYNANPSSMRVSIQTFLDLKESKTDGLLILGQMNELGKFAEEEHQDLIDWIIKENSEVEIYLIGDLFKTIKPNNRVNFFSDFDSLNNAFTNEINSSQTREIFIKGSRSNELEKLVEGLV